MAEMLTPLVLSLFSVCLLAAQVMPAFGQEPVKSQIQSLRAEFEQAYARKDFATAERKMLKALSLSGQLQGELRSETQEYLHKCLNKVYEKEGKSKRFDLRPTKSPADVRPALTPEQVEAGVKRRTVAIASQIHEERLSTGDYQALSVTTREPVTVKTLTSGETITATAIGRCSSDLGILETAVVCKFKVEGGSLNLVWRDISVLKGLSQESKAPLREISFVHEPATENELKMSVYYEYHLDRDGDWVPDKKLKMQRYHYHALALKERYKCSEDLVDYLERQKTLIEIEDRLLFLVDGIPDKTKYYTGARVRIEKDPTMAFPHFLLVNEDIDRAHGLIVRLLGESNVPSNR